ncbi:MAG: hypothetical protein KIS87_14695 [Phycisphaeraceae bacterium]|nr:hypothetical protein [Phycisphaeraceae bacterium]
MLITQHGRSIIRRGTSLIEVVVVVVVLGIAVPPSVVVVQEAMLVRTDAVQITRATALAQSLVEHVLADAYSDAPGLGYSALADTNAWLNTPSTGLRARAADTTSLYENLGFSYTIDVTPPHAASGAATGDPGLDLFRTVTVTVTWTRATGGTQSLPISVVVAEL